MEKTMYQIINSLVMLSIQGCIENQEIFQENQIL